ncbi:hypothetical protein EVAR_8318_1 [Eumeta japonica]|uniref:Uncharacterized protein n=1 Tax=Eumeta variegata TaxID=151549 RepID=A0A4C1VFN3_EUMVA|nr:hypothetical protein EVAR_8318_1 [Eumeta japonica]
MFSIGCCDSELNDGAFVLCCWTRRRYFDFLGFCARCGFIIDERPDKGSRVSYAIGCVRFCNGIAEMATRPLEECRPMFGGRARGGRRSPPSEAGAARPGSFLRYGVDMEFDMVMPIFLIIHF